MAAHIVVAPPGAHALPATLSRDLLTGVLRDRIGFDGLIITDSLTMKAAEAVEKPAVEAIRAGADMLLKPGDARLVQAQILTAISDGSLTLERIEESVLRIIRKKNHRGIGSEQKADPVKVLGSEAHRSIVAEVTESP
jgi:beta-N-acetylhexosaminidase